MQIKQLLLKLKSFGLDINELKSKDTDLQDQITNLKEQVDNLNVSETILREIEKAFAEFDKYIDAADATLQGNIDKVEQKVTALQGTVNGIDKSWAAVTNKPFETLGTTLEASQGNVLNVKVDNTTIEASAGGNLKVKDDVFASKGHELNTDIHLTTNEKANVAKITTIENEVNLLKTTVGTASAHIIVKTKAELEGLKDTSNHATIAHVIDTNETYILEKDTDVNANLTTPEWIKISDSDALVSVDWSAINSKPFNTVSDGLRVDADAIKVNTDDTTIEINKNKIKVKDGVFSKIDHTHVVDFNDITNKPTVFTEQIKVSNFTEGTDADTGLSYVVIEHNKKSMNIDVKAFGADNIERLICVEHVNENSFKLWTDEKENLTVRVFSFDFGTSSPISSEAIVGKAKAGSIKVGHKK